MRNVVVVEKTANNHSAYVPDLPGCAVMGKTRADVLRENRVAIRFHLDGLGEDGMTLATTKKVSRGIYVEV